MKGHFIPHTKETKKMISRTKLSHGKSWKERLPYCFCGEQLSRMDAKCCKQHYGLNRIGEKNTNWKGDMASYCTIHNWIRRNLGTPKQCEQCKKDGLDGHYIHWANISRKYKRIATDWKRLCVKCHKTFDNNYHQLARL